MSQVQMDLPFDEHCIASDHQAKKVNIIHRMITGSVLRFVVQDKKVS